MNESRLTKILWHSPTQKKFFLIQSSYEFPIGGEILEDMSGNHRITNLESLQSFEVSSENAQIHLENNWQNSIEQAKKAWNELYHLSEISGRGYDLEELKNSLLKEINTEESGAGSAINQSKKAIEQLIKSVQSGDPSSSAEQQTALRDILEQMPMLSQFFSKEELEKAANDPETWAEQLQKQFIDPIERENKEKASEKLAKDIQASIADGLRRAGITPAADFDIKNEDQLK